MHIYIYLFIRVDYTYSYVSKYRYMRTPTCTHTAKCGGDIRHKEKERERGVISRARMEDKDNLGSATSICLFCVRTYARLLWCCRQAA